MVPDTPTVTNWEPVHVMPINALVVPEPPPAPEVTGAQLEPSVITVRVVLPNTPFKLAPINEVPAATPVTNPLLLTVALAKVAEVQVACVVMSCVLLSE